LLPTAEEQGLLGSKYFVDNLNSLYADLLLLFLIDLLLLFLIDLLLLFLIDLFLHRNYNIISVINFDLMNIFGATKDITFYGFSKCNFNKNIENIAIKCAGIYVLVSNHQTK
jgi:Zn-dependent M28 family amino/carboxypeptidase